MTSSWCVRPMRVYLRLLALVMCLVAQACAWGSNISQFPIREPVGITTVVELNDLQRVSGELITVGQSELLIRTEGPPHLIVLVRLPQVRWASCPSLSLRWIEDGQPVPDRFDQVRLLGRFPAGVSADVLAGLLDVDGQTQPITVEQGVHQ